MTTNDEEMMTQDLWGQEISIDFGAVDDSFTIPKGKYRAEIVSATPGRAKASGEAKIDIRWKVVDGDHANRQIIDNISFHPNRAPQTKRVLKALGFDVSGQLGKSLGQLAEELIGLTAVIDVDIEKPRTVDGVTYDARNRVKSVQSDNGSVGDVIAESEDIPF